MAQSDDGLLLDALSLLDGVLLRWDADSRLVEPAPGSSGPSPPGTDGALHDVGHWLAAVAPGERNEVADFYRTVQRSLPGTLHERRYSLMGMDGESTQWVAERTMITVAGDGSYHRLAYVYPVNELVGAEHQLMAEKERLELVLSGTNLGLWDWYIESNEFAVDRRGAEILRCPHDLRQKCDRSEYLEQIHADDRSKAGGSLDAAAAGQVQLHDVELRLSADPDVWIRSRGRVVIHGVDGRPQRMSGILEDISERKAHEVELRAESVRDHLTGLGNRRHFERTVEVLVDARAREGATFALLMLDVDNLKAINDRDGHLAGDEALRLVADTLSTCLRGDDVAVRLSGDEFAAVLPRATAADARIVGLRIQESLADQGGERPLSASIGVGSVDEVAGPEAAVDIRDLISLVDGRLYADKESRRSRQQGYV